jgi:phosphate transport system protein
MIQEKQEELQQMFSEQAARVIKMVDIAVRALRESNDKLVMDVIEEYEPRCNQAQIEIEDVCVEILTLYAPKAVEMRRVIAIIKGNGDLERIGDQATNIAKYALYLIPRPPVKKLIDIPRMAEVAQDMVQTSLDAFLQQRLDLANSVFDRDNIVDGLNEQIIRELITYMASDPSKIERSMRLVFISRALERIGDLAMNLSEEVIYYLTGEDIRHPGNKKGS